MSTKTFTERCKMFEQCLPDAPYRAMLTNLHAEMLAKLAEQPAPVQQEPSHLKRLAAICPELNMSNYNSDDVDELNHWAIEVATAIDLLAEQPAPVVPVQHKPTTYTERFTHAVAVLCGAQPPAEMVAEWFEDVEVNGGHRLQSWVGAQHATPSWAQCIVVLDAAHVLASDPEEGEGHEDVDGGTPQAQTAPEIAMADAYRAGVDSGIAAEREACAELCSDIDGGENMFSRAIRARGNT